MKTIEELKREVEDLKKRAGLPALTPEEQERAKLRAERAREKRRVEALEREAREAREDELFEDLEAAHPHETLHRIDANGGMIVMRTPTVAKGRAFQQMAIKGKLSVDALEEFVKPCIVHPVGEELEERLERAALLVPTLVSIAQEIASEEAKQRAAK